MSTHVNALLTTSITEFPALIKELREKTAEIIASSTLADETILSRYGSYGIGIFTEMMGYTLAKAHSPLARYTIEENLDCEMRDKHPELLYQLLRQAGATPTRRSDSHMVPIMQRLRDEMSYVDSIGLFGTMHFAMIENTSLVFVPDIGKRAKRLGATDLLYVEIHGEADIEHAQAFIKATVAEALTGKYDYRLLAETSAQLTLDIIERIYH